MGAVAVEAALRWRRAGSPYLLTRDELVEELARRGYVTSERQIVSWVSYGILPKPERKVPKLAGKHLPRALYPAYLIPALQDLLYHARQNTTIAQLRETAPTIVAAWHEQIGDGLPGAQLAATGHGTSSGTATTLIVDPRVRPPTTRPTGDRPPSPPAVPRALQRALWAYAQQLAELRQTALVEARIVVCLAEGKEVAIPVPAPPPPRAKQRRGG
jgi:hypothetical protein